MLILRHILLLCLFFSITECQILSGLKSWWSSYGGNDQKTNNNKYQAYTTSAVQQQDKKVVSSIHEGSVVHYGEWTSAPKPSTTPGTIKRPYKIVTIPSTTRKTTRKTTRSITSKTTRSTTRKTTRTTTRRTTRTTTRRTTRTTTRRTTTRGISTTRSTTQRSSTREFEFYESVLLDHTVIYITTPAPGARRIGLGNLATAAPLVVGDWTRSTSAPSDASEGSLFDSMTSVKRTPPVTKSPTTAPPTTLPAQPLVTTTSLFDSTEIFYENFTKPDAGSVIVSNPLLDAITNKNVLPLKSKFPALPDKFMDVIKNHTNTLKSLFSDETTTTVAQTKSPTTTTTPTTTNLPEKSLFSPSSQSDSNENTFSVSRPSGKIDESLIVSGLKRQTRLDVSLEKNSRFGLSRPMVRGVINESDRSSDPPEKTVKFFKNHKYSFLTHSRDEKDLTIEEILEVSRNKKDFETSPRFKPKYPVYIKQDVSNSISGREARQQDPKVKRLLEANLPFVTGSIFDSGTGQVEDLDLNKSRSLFLEERGDDGEDDDEDSEDGDDAEGENEEKNSEESVDGQNDLIEELDEDDIEDKLELNAFMENEEGPDYEGSGDYVGLGPSYKERTLNDNESLIEEDETKSQDGSENDDSNDDKEDYEKEDEEDNVDDEGEDGDNEEDNYDEEDIESNEEKDYDEDNDDKDGDDSDEDDDTIIEDGVNDILKERSLITKVKTKQKEQKAVIQRPHSIQYPGPLHYRLVPHYSLPPVPLHYYRPAQYRLVPRPYVYLYRNQHVYLQ